MCPSTDFVRLHNDGRLNMAFYTTDLRSGTVYCTVFTTSPLSTIGFLSTDSYT